MKLPGLAASLAILTFCASSPALAFKHGPPERRLRAALLRVQDLPSGWAPLDVGSFENAETIVYNWCGKKFPQPLRQETAQFSNNGLIGAVTSVDVMRFGPGVAKAALDLVARAPKCEPRKDVIDGEAIQTSRMNIDKLGDQSVALHLQGESSGVYEDIVFIRRGDIVSVVAVAGGLFSAPPIAPLARKADQLLAKHALRA